MSKTLSLDALAVETFSTQGVGDLSYAAAAAPSLRYTQCDTCGAGCTNQNCQTASANYTDCGSCGIACTAIEPC